MTGLRDLPSLSVRRPTLVIVANFLILLAGLAALFAMEIRELPDVDRPIVTVRAFFEGASPETMDAEVTSVIEGAVARVSGVKSIKSASEEDNCRVRIEFLTNIDLDVAANDVREAVAAIRRRLPEGVTDVTVVKADNDASPIIRLALVSNTLPQETLTRLAEDEISSELAAIPGVATVQLFGDRKQVLRIVIDPMKLARFGLAVDDVARVMADADLDVPAGSFKSEDQLLLVRANAMVWRIADIEMLQLKPNVRLGDVAQAIYGPAQPLSHSLLNGARVVGFGILRRARANTIDISADVDKTIERLNHRLKGAKIVKISDDAIFIQGSIREVIISLMIAVAVVVAVLFIFIRNIRLTLIPTLAIPIALIGTLAAIWLLGFSINILTLLALVLATGMIVDDAIVVIENIQRQRSLGREPLAAAVLGTRQVFFAVLATTATLISVFIPIAFLPSTAGRLFTEFGFVLAIAVAISSFVALTLCPMLAARLPAEKMAPARADPASRGGQAFRGGIYGRFLDFTLSARFFILGGASVVAAAAFALFPSIDRELLPTEDRGAIYIYLQGPDGVGLDYMDRQAVQVEKLLQPLRQAGEISAIYTIVGRWDLNRVYIAAPLAPWSKRQRSQAEIAGALRGKLKTIAGAHVRLRQPNSLNLWRTGNRIEFALTGSNYPEIAGAADDFLSQIYRHLPQLTRPEVEYQQTQPQLTVRVDRRRAEDLGVEIMAITNTLRAMIDGYEVAKLNVNDRSVPIRLESSGGAISDPSDLANLFVHSKLGALVPLSAFVTLKEIGVAAELDRAGQKRAVEIDARLRPGYKLPQAIVDIEKLAKTALPAGIGLRFINEAEAFKDTSNEVALTFAIVIIVVLLVLAAQFESFLSALVVVLTVPFGAAAAVFALKLTGTSLNIYSQIGLVLLIGLMAKNGILVVEFADQLRDTGLDVMAAVREAAITRLRPVLMTMLSTVLGALPLILSSGPGAEARAAIGWIVFGGLGIATVFTLVLIPVIYSLLAPYRAPRAQAGARLQPELETSADQDRRSAVQAAE